MTVVNFKEHHEMKVRAEKRADFFVSELHSRMGHIKYFDEAFWERQWQQFYESGYEYEKIVARRKECD